ncbi:MAG TPA: hypothetical protein VM120_12400 [Bryobacteraceae bacterium]|nr:hypothetical protein [Bryobacteraceae bacterium]
MQPREARRRGAKENRKEIGKRDGALAAAIASSDGIPSNTTIFCDREGGDAIKEGIDYYAGWVTGLAHQRDGRQGRH